MIGYFIPDEKEDNEEPVYCPNCLRVGLRKRLGDIVYFPDEKPQKGDENIIQCHHCGRKYRLELLEDEDEKEETNEKYK